jgi:hypothetical protein
MKGLLEQILFASHTTMTKIGSSPLVHAIIPYLLKKGEFYNVKMFLVLFI